MKKILSYVLATFLIVFTFHTTAFATATLLPSDIEVENMTEEECKNLIKDLEYSGKLEAAIEEQTQDMEQLLGCAIKSGYIKFWMVPFFIRNILQFLIGLAGLISVLMIILGAYYYIAGGLTDDKEKGKTIIKYAIGGLILTTLAWFIVNVILLAVTS